MRKLAVAVAIALAGVAFLATPAWAGSGSEGPDWSMKLTIEPETPAMGETFTATVTFVAKANLPTVTLSIASPYTSASLPFKPAVTQIHRKGAGPGTGSTASLTIVSEMKSPNAVEIVATAEWEEWYGTETHLLSEWVKTGHWWTLPCNVPASGEETPIEPPSEPTIPPCVRGGRTIWVAQYPGATTCTSGTVNVNVATIEELDTLPGVGPVTAQRIVDYRETYGFFETPEDLLNVPGIGPVTLEKMLPYLCVELPDQVIEMWIENPPFSFYPDCQTVQWRKDLDGVWQFWGGSGWEVDNGANAAPFAAVVRLALQESDPNLVGEFYTGPVTGVPGFLQGLLAE